MSANYIQRWNPFERIDREPQYSLDELSQLSGVAKVVIRNWIDRKLVILDGAIHREDGKHRRFSSRDVEVVRIVHQLTNKPSVSEAAAIAARRVTRWPYKYWDGTKEKAG